MIKLEMELSDIDYEVLVKEVLPKVADRLKQSGSPLAPLLSGGMAANVLLRASDGVRDRMAAEILNAAAPRLTGTLGREPAVSELAAAAQREGCVIRSMKERDESLESFYMNLVGGGCHA